MSGAGDFSYTEIKSGLVFISWQGRHVVTLSGPKGARFLAQVAQATDDAEAQLVMARFTGNFKRGNERPSG